MFHPVGSQPPNVYWRRRVLLFGSGVVLLVLIVITFSALASSGSGKASGQPAAAGSTSSTPKQTKQQSGPSEKIHSSAPVTKASAPTSRSSSSPDPGGSPSTGNTPTSTGAAPARCTASELRIQALTSKTSYQVGDHPAVEMRVTNVGSSPCVQDLADSQVLLKVYNGESRVWGSHDCAIQPGTTLRTLAVRAPVIVSMTWSGLTSTPGCKGTRQRVGAGSYTLYAALSGHTGTAAQFTIG